MEKTNSSNSDSKNLEPKKKIIKVIKKVIRIVPKQKELAKEDNKVTVYVLKLIDNKFYVGRTTDTIPRYKSYENVPINYLGNRINAHFDGNGSVWTKKYKPIKIMNIYHNCVPEDEDKHVKIMMRQYGIDNVRGGNYSTINLDPHTVEHLQKEINGNVDKCYRCGKEGHFINQCTEPDEFNNERLLNSNAEINKSLLISPIDDAVWVCIKCEKDFDNKLVYDKHFKICGSPLKQILPRQVIKNNVCYKCGRNDHYASECFAKTHISGTQFNDSESSSSDDDTCYRCGRSGHYASNCYAKTRGYNNYTSAYYSSDDDY